MIRTRSTGVEVKNALVRATSPSALQILHTVSFINSRRLLIQLAYMEYVID